MPAAQRAVTRISTERQLLQMFGSGLTAGGSRRACSRRAEVKEVKRRRGDHHRGRGGLRHLRHPPRLDDRREGHRRQAGLPLLSAGRLLCRRDGADRRRPAHRDGRAAIKSEVIRLDGDAFRRAARAQAASCSTRRKRDMAARRKVNAFIEASKDELRRRRRHVFRRSPASWSTTASARRPTCC